jgi:hypothetical protein
MSASKNEKANDSSRWPDSTDRTDQGAIEIDHNPIQFRSLTVALLVILNGARSIVNQLAVTTSTPPFVIVEVANLIEHACDLLASYLATGGQP